MKKKTGYTIGTLIILLICAFVFVIVPALQQNGGNSGNALVFGKYGKDEIKYAEGTEMQNYVSRTAQMYQNYGIQLNDTYYWYIFSDAFNACVQRVAYKDFVKKSGYTAPSSATKRVLRDYFTDENGNFSQKLYNQADDSYIQSLTKDIEQDLIAQRFNDDVFGAGSLYGLKESTKELEFLSAMNTNKRGFNAAIFKLTDYPEDEKVKYAKENASRFTKYDLSAVVVADKNEAAKVANNLSTGAKTFEDEIAEVSTKYGTDTEGKLLNPYQYQIENLLTNKSDIGILAGLKENEVSDIIEMNGSFAIFRCNSEKVEADFEDSEIMRIVGNYLLANESTMIEDYFAAKANDFITVAKTSSFDEAAAALEVSTEVIDPFPLNYGNVSIADSFDSAVAGLDGIETNENFLKTAFGLALNDYSDPLVLTNGVVVLQYTTADEGEPKDAISELEGYDSASSTSAIMKSPKLVNNFSEVYFNNFN